eukprot:1145463-Pelagomonas_calceolata.AAC.1
MRIRQVVGHAPIRLDSPSRRSSPCIHLRAPSDRSPRSPPPKLTKGLIVYSLKERKKDYACQVWPRALRK